MTLAMKVKSNPWFGHLKKKGHGNMTAFLELALIFIANKIMNWQGICIFNDYSQAIT